MLQEELDLAHYYLNNRVKAMLYHLEKDGKTAIPAK